MGKKYFGLIILGIFTVSCFLGHKILMAENPYVRSEVKIISGGNRTINPKIESMLTNVIQELNKIAAGNLPKNDSTLLNIRNNFTGIGYRHIKDLLRYNNIYSIKKNQEVHLIECALGYEVRDMQLVVENPVEDDTQDTDKSNSNSTKTKIDNIHLAFTIDFNNEIAAVREQMDSFNYRQVIEDGEKLQDFAYRQAILHFLETLRTAYNKKDISYLEKIYSDNVIIVGVERPGTLSSERFFELLFSGGSKQARYLRLSKRKYIDRLKNKIFKINSFINVEYRNIEIQRHPKLKDIYGVNLFQRLNSTYYSDEGYLFLMFDFKNIEKYTIRVRTWQDERFADDSVVRLQDFEIID